MVATLELREQVIDSYLDCHTPEEPLPGHAELVALAVHVAGVKSASLNMIRAGGHTVVSSPVLDDGTVIPREASMCARVIDQGMGPVHVPDARLDSRFSDSPMVTGEMASCRFYASFPLRSPQGVEVGTLCLFDEEVLELDPARLEALAMLSRRVVDLYELTLRDRELATAAEVLTVQAADLERTVATLDAFTGQVGHDLKNPLASLRMSLELLHETGAVQHDAEASWLADSSLSAVRRMDTMVTECLEAARRGGRAVTTPVDLGVLVDAVEADLAGRLRDCRLVRGDLPTVLADRAQMLHLVQNLVANAGKFTASCAEPLVRVSATTRPDGGFRLEVGDNGPGVPVRDRPHVFRTRWQGSHDVPGLGLGLATCQRVADAHGGRLEVGEAPEGGALFALEVPGMSTEDAVA